MRAPDLEPALLIAGVLCLVTFVAGRRPCALDADDSVEMALTIGCGLVIAAASCWRPRPGALYGAVVGRRCCSPSRR